MESNSTAFLIKIKLRHSLGRPSRSDFVQSEFGGVLMYEVSEAFHRQYADMYDKFVRIHFKDGSVRTGLFNDEFYDDSSILVSCEVIKITDIDRMELLDK